MSITDPAMENTAEQISTAIDALKVPESQVSTVQRAEAQPLKRNYVPMKLAKKAIQQQD